MMAIPTKTPTLIDVEPEPAAALEPVAVDSNVSMFERLARDPSVTVEKLQQLMGMQERIMATNRKAAFDAAFAKMQPHIPIIDEHGRIEVKGTLRSTYAPLEDIHSIVKPITAQYGFAIRHRTEWPQDKPNIIRIVGILSHEHGHSEETIFEAPTDKSDFRSDIQSMGSTVSYGRRYTTLDLLNISTRKLDNDGQRSQASAVQLPPAPDGYDTWKEEMEAVAVEGLKKLMDTWKDSKPEYRNRVVKSKADVAWWGDLRKKAPR
jgi:hypothetical protein